MSAAEEILHALGAHERPVVVIHHDDLGVTRAQNAAHKELKSFPTGSIMMPTAWAAEWIGEQAYDLGVHITLTSEWTAPRWRPLTCASSLVDAHGYLWQTLEDAWQHIRPEEAEAEMRAQIDAALAMGIDITHLDTHMGAVLRPDLAQIYLSLGMEYRVPVLLPTREDLRQVPMPTEFRQPLERLLDSVPYPLMHLVDGYSAPPSQRQSWLREVLTNLEAGLYHLIHHAAIPTHEAKALPDWETRAADFDAFSSLDAATTSRIRIITYRELRDMYRDAGIL